MLSAPVVVTGATGFIGSRLVARLLADGREVTAAGRDVDRLGALARHGARTVVWHADRRGEPEALPLRPGCTVFHLAATRSAQRRRDAASALEAINVAATSALAEQARRQVVGRFVLVASAVVYGPSTVPRRERDGHAPADAYARSRSRGATAVLDLARRGGLPALVIHPTIVYGADDGARPNVVARHLRGLLRHRLDVTVGDGRSGRDLVHVSDVVATLLAAESRGAVGQEYIVAGSPTSHRELNHLALALAGRRARLRLRLPPPACRAAALTLDRLFRLDSDCGYDQRIQTLLSPWSYDDAEARRQLGHAPPGLEVRLRETVAALTGKDGAGP